MGYCHCQSCRAWSAGPVNAFSLWAPDAIRIVRGADQIGAFSKTANSIRKWCKQCGGHLMTEHPGFGLTDVYTAVIPHSRSLPCFTSTMARRFSLHDGLPKQRDFPKEMGGSGLLVHE